MGRWQRPSPQCRCELTRVPCAQYSLGSTSLTKDISTYVKREYDLAYPSDGAPLPADLPPFARSGWLLCASRAAACRRRGSCHCARTVSDGAHASVSATGKATTGVFHCVCGRSFAAACTYETHYSMWFNVQCPDAVISVLLWRSKDNPYD